MSHLQLRRFAVALGFVVLGCAGSRASERTAARDDAVRAPAPEARESAGRTPGGEMPCPLGVPGTRVAASDTDQGVALTFTNPEHPEAVRERARHAAAMHARMAAHHAGGAGPGEMHGGMHGGTHGGMHGAPADGEHAGCCQGMDEGMSLMHAATVRAEDAPGGARLVFTPADPADLPGLREAVALHAGRVAEQGCGMMGSGSTGAARPEPGAPGDAPADHEAHHPER